MGGWVDKTFKLLRFVKTSGNYGRPLSCCKLAIARGHAFYFYCTASPFLDPSCSCLAHSSAFCRIRSTGDVHGRVKSVSISAQVAHHCMKIFIANSTKWWKVATQDLQVTGRKTNNSPDSAMVDLGRVIIAIVKVGAGRRSTELVS